MNLATWFLTALLLMSVIRTVEAEPVEIPVIFPEPRLDKVMLTGEGDVLFLEMSDGAVVEDPMYVSDDPQYADLELVEIYPSPFQQISYVGTDGRELYCIHMTFITICLDWLERDRDVILSFPEDGEVTMTDLDGQELYEPFDFRKRNLEDFERLEVRNFTLLEFQDAATGERIWRISAR